MITFEINTHEQFNGISVEEMALSIIRYIYAMKGIRVVINLDVTNDKEVQLFGKAYDIAKATGY